MGVPINFQVRHALQSSQILLSVVLNSKHRALTTLCDLKPFNSRLSSLMKNGHVEEAQQLFDDMHQRNTVTYNAMIRGYFQSGFSDKAISLYNQMPVRDIFSFNTMICGLMQCGDVNGAEQVFKSMHCRDIVTWNSIISGYVDNDLVEEAVNIFEIMPLKDVVSWNLVIAGLVKIKEFVKAEKLFSEMSTRDVASWTIIMKAYLASGQIVKAREIFDDMPMKDIHAWNTMISSYIQNKCVEIAESLFHKMPEKDWNSWNIMIEGLVGIRRVTDAMKLFNDMPWKCKKSLNFIMWGFVRNGFVKEVHAILEKTSFANIVSWTNVMVGYFNMQEVESAIKVFECMPDHDTTVCNVAIFGLGENDRSEDGIKLFTKMKENGMCVDEATITSFLTICSNLPSLNLGKQIHAEVIKVGINFFTSVGNAFVTMYFRCGSIDSALREFNSMTTHDIISWNSVICGLAHNGYGERAIEMFEKMRLTNVMPNEVTLIGVLSACSHAGLVERGKYYFDIMKHEYFLQLTIKHYTCMVDLLGKFGLIDEALNIVNQMRIDGLEVHASVWGALLGACRMHKNATLGKIAGEKILELEPSNSGIYMILSEIFLANGRKEEAESMLIRMKDNGVKKQPGCSWIESSTGGNVFLAGDKTHSEFKRVANALDLLYLEIGSNDLELNDLFGEAI